MTNQKTPQKTSHTGQLILHEAKTPKVLGMGIGKLASVTAFTLESTAIIDLADKLELKPEIRAVGVVNKKGKAVGIITRKDLFGMLSRPFGRDVLRKKTVSNLLSKVRIFNINENIFTVSEEIEEKVNSNVSHFFLLENDRNEFSGIFSGKDMLVFLAEITRQDIALSKKIQTRIVKEEDDFTGSGYSLAASSMMAKGIGGDFYSFKKISDSISLIVLCDVSGKGMAASLLSSLISGFINTYPAGEDLTGLVADLNTQLTQSFAGEKFVTGLFILFNSETGLLTVADMGHSHFMHFSKGVTCKAENSIINIPLGVSPDIDVKTFNIGLKKNDCLLMMTDGITEQKNEAGSLFSYKDILSIFREHQKISAKAMRARLLAGFESFKGAAARTDDMTFLVLKYNATSGSDAIGKSEEKKNSINSKIKWAITTGKPIQIKTNRYLPEDREFIDSVLDRFLNEAGIKFLMNKISYCVHELATNAKKANTKRVYFKAKGLNLENKSHYELGMKSFKTDTFEKIDHYLDRQKKLGYFIVIMFQLTRKELKITVINNSEMASEEKIRVKNKLAIASKSASIGEIYDQIEDYSEGAGLGIVMMSQMLRTMGFGPDVLNIESEQGLTTASITLKLRE